MKSEPTSLFDRLDHFIQADSEKQLLRGLSLLRLFFITFMVIYLAVCLFSITVKLFDFLLIQGVLDFQSMKVLLADALFTLIVMAIVKALFIKNSFEYALTFLEIAFVVVIRKLILLETVPKENMTLLILGGISTALFILIIYIQTEIRRWKLEELKATALES